MHRTTVAVVVGVGLGLGLASCGTAGQPGPAETGVVDRVPTSTTAASRSACADTPRQGVSSVMVDWVDFVQLDGIQYVAGPGQAETVPSGDLDGVLGRVTCKLDGLKFTKPPGPAVDGDAAFLDIGTGVYAIKGFARSCRVAVKHQGVNRVYVATPGAGGRTAQAACAGQ